MSTMTATAPLTASVRPLGRDEWNEVLERLSAEDDLRATVEIEGDAAGGTAAERLPLTCITLEDGDDQIAIGLGGRHGRHPVRLWHYVHHPRRMQVAERGQAIVSLTFTGRDGTRTILRLSDERS